MKKKFDYRNLILIVVSLAFTLALLEGGLRVLFSSDQSFLAEQYQDREFLTSNKYWGVWHFPDNRVEHRRDCFEAVYKTNQYGMKGPDFDTASGKPRIAFLGDSYIEGHGKSNHRILSFYFDSLTQSSHDILNFGTSGGFGTVDEVVLYENFARFFKPDLTILFFLNYNDLYDNLKSQGKGLIDERGEFTHQKSVSLSETMKEVRSTGEPGVAFSGISGLYVFSLAGRGVRSLTNFFQYVVNIKFDFRTAIAKVYTEKGSERIRKGYFLVEKSLQRLDSLTKADSSRLLVVNFADPFQTDENWLRFNEKKLGEALIPHLPNRKISEICKKNDIAYYDMYPETVKTIREKNMEYPYFFHSCDRHLSAEGNEYMASLLYKYLKRKKYISW